MTWQHADIWSHPSCYPVDLYTSSWSPKDHEWPSHIPFVQCKSALPFLAISKFDLKNPWWRPCMWSKVKVTIHIVGSATNRFTSFLFKLALAFGRYSYKNLPWKPKVKVMAKVRTDGYIWGLVFNWYVDFTGCGNWIILFKDLAN